MDRPSPRSTARSDERRLARGAALLALAIALVPVVMLLAAAAWLRSPAGEARARRLVERVASERLGATVRMRHLHGAPPCTVTVDGLEVAGARGRRVARVERLRVEASPLGLLRGRASADVELDRPTLDLPAARALLATRRSRAALDRLPRVEADVRLRDGVIVDASHRIPVAGRALLAASRDGLALRSLDGEAAGVHLRAHGTIEPRAGSRELPPGDRRGDRADVRGGRVDLTVDELSLPRGEPALPRAPVLTTAVVAHGRAAGPLDAVALDGSARVGRGEARLRGVIDLIRRRGRAVVTVEDLEPPVAEADVPVLSLRLSLRGALAPGGRLLVDGTVGGRYVRRPYDGALASLPRPAARRVAARMRSRAAGGVVDGRVHLRVDGGRLAGRITIDLAGEDRAAQLVGASSSARRLRLVGLLSSTARGAPRLRWHTTTPSPSSGSIAPP